MEHEQALTETLKRIDAVDSKGNIRKMFSTSQFWKNMYELGHDAIEAEHCSCTKE